MLASLIFDVILSIPAEQRKKEVTVVCTDTRVEIPAIAEMIEGTLDRMRKCSQQNGPNVSDTSTPSCGSSRFGCWTCTVVERDRD
jgi:3'-phosphoadenosine 5'-phosphosulfate sulfotransferase (PAPS reductase)/FAD synthetase